MFLDSDDCLREDSLDIINKTLSVDAVDLVVFGNVNLKSGSGYVPSESISDHIFYEAEIKTKVLPFFLNLTTDNQYNILPCVTNKCYSKQILQNVLFDETFPTWEDGLFNIFVLRDTNSCVCISEKLYQINDGGYAESFHLASRYFPNLAEKWIYQYEVVCSLFGQIYDCKSQYAVSRYWRILDGILTNAVINEIPNKMGVFQSVALDKTVKEWSKTVRPISNFEMLKLFSIRTKNWHMLYGLYYMGYATSKCSVETFKIWLRKIAIKLRLLR